MASVTGPGEHDGPPVNSKQLEEALYAACASCPPNKAFGQQELIELHVIPNDDLNQLHSCVQALVKARLLKLFTRDGSPCWKVVKREDAEKYKQFTGEEAMVYSHIESSNREGIWTRTIRQRTNLHQTVMNRCIKTLESKGFIKPVQTSKFPKRKTYMLAHLQPSDDVTGGPFYTDGNLDEEFVLQMANWSERYVIGRSWQHVPSKEPGKRKEQPRLTSEQAENLRAEVLHVKDAGKEKSRAMLPMPAGFTGYPTIPEITKAINASGLSGVVMKEAEMQQLMDILCWDGRMVRVMNGKGYKAVRRFGGEDGLKNGLTELPCGRCPVFDLCEEGGPVNARSCEYFQEWLAI